MTLYQDKDVSAEAYHHRLTKAQPRRAADLVERIEIDVATGHLVGGDRLPPVRDLAASLGLAPNTVASAYRRLADRGVVAGHGRRGTFVLARPPLGVHESPPIPEGALDLASGNPDRALLPDLAPHLAPAGASTLYTDPVVLSELASAAATWLGGQGVPAERLTVTSGALDAIERVLRTGLRPGDAVAVERPGWVAVRDLVSAMGLRVIEIDVDEHGIRAEALEAVLPAVAAVIVTPRAQNPTGAAVDSTRRSQLLEVLDRRPEVLVVEDDHAGPVAGAALRPLGPGRLRWAFVQSVAKVLGPDLRLALVTGDDLTVDRVAGRFALGPGWVSRLLQGAVASMLVDPEVSALLARAADEYRRRRDALLDALDDVGVTGAMGISGMNVWVPVAAEQPAIAASAAAGFLVREGAAFGGREPAVRVTVSNLAPERAPALAMTLAAPLGASRRAV